MKPGPMKDYLSMYEVGDGGCWLFLGKVGKNGYGMCRGQGAHRYFYEHLVGPIPKGMHLDHLCHDPKSCNLGGECPHRRCVNPAHLEPCTPRENVMRSNSFVAKFGGATHCVNGHELSGENLIVTPGRRRCATCQKATWERRREKTRSRILTLDNMPESHRVLHELLKESEYTSDEIASAFQDRTGRSLSPRTAREYCNDLHRSSLVTRERKVKGLRGGPAPIVWRAL